MVKKILIAAVAVVAGLAVLSGVTKISPKVWFEGCCRSARNMVPPETRLKQLHTEIDSIDKDIKKNLSKLARMEVDVQMLSEDLEGKRGQQGNLRTEINDLRKGLEAGVEKVSFNGRSFRPADATRRLNMATTEFVSLKERIKGQEQLLSEKNRTLDAAKNRITDMKTEQDNLRLLAAKLGTQIELAKMKQMEARMVDIDDGAVSRAREHAKELEIYLREIKEETRLNQEFGFSAPTALEKEQTKTREEVLKAARQALQEDEPAESVVEKK